LFAQAAKPAAKATTNRIAKNFFIFVLLFIL